jgi:galactose mutarotase-like enzyme
MTERETFIWQGWEIVRLATSAVSAEIAPGKGGDVLSLKWRATDVELLWQTPWGLRARGAAGTSEDDVARLMEAYPGGWQSVFPNGGDAVIEHGVAWGMHGEVWLTPFEWEPIDKGIEMRARLVRSPFEVVKRITLHGAALTVTEIVTNVGGQSVEVMWSQHPAFGPPLIGPDARIETAAKAVLADDGRDTSSFDLDPGSTSIWPHASGRDGVSIDLRTVPPQDAGVDRLAYLSNFVEGHAAITNPRPGLRVDLDWDATTMPYAWYWLEANGSAGFPWYRSAYVLAIEPATSYPAQGIAAVRRTTGTQLQIASGEQRTNTVSLTTSSTIT